MREINKEDFSDFLKSMRMSVGLDQTTLAKQLNLKPSVLKKYEECRGIPDDTYAFEYDLRDIVKREIQSRKFKIPR